MKDFNILENAAHAAHADTGVKMQNILFKNFSKLSKSHKFCTLTKAIKLLLF